MKNYFNDILEHMNAYKSLSYAEWPDYDPDLSKEDLIFKQLIKLNELKFTPEKDIAA